MKGQAADEVAKSGLFVGEHAHPQAPRPSGE
jgi:hypothetical protein